MTEIFVRWSSHLVIWIYLNIFSSFLWDCHSPWRICNVKIWIWDNSYVFSPCAKGDKLVGFCFFYSSFCCTLFNVLCNFSHCVLFLVVLLLFQHIGYSWYSLNDKKPINSFILLEILLPIASPKAENWGYYKHAHISLLVDLVLSLNFLRRFCLIKFCQIYSGGLTDLIKLLGDCCHMYHVMHLFFGYNRIQKMYMNLWILARK